MTVKMATKMARLVASRFRVDLLAVGPVTIDGEEHIEVRFKHPKVDWYAVAMPRASLGDWEFKDEVVTSARHCAEGPPS